MKQILRYITLILLLFSALAAEAGDVRIRVEMPRGKRMISMGDLFYINIEVTDIDQEPKRPSNVPGAKVMYFDRVGSSSRFSNINGKTTQSYSYTYALTLKANETGKFSFGPVSVGGVKSNTVSYEIVSASATQSGAVDANRRSSSQGAAQSKPDASGAGQDDNKPKYIGKGDGNLFLKANVSKTKCYEQEALVYTVKLFTTYDAIKFIGATATPKFDGFVVEESKDVSNQFNYETVNGKTYATAIIARYIIFPQMTGTLKVTGNTYTVSVDEREYYHDPFWGSLSTVTPLQLNVTPNDLSINVESLPSPKPADFCGGVGQFKIVSSLPSKDFLTNSAASIVYTVAGTGNLKYIALPDLKLLYPDQLEVYSPETDVKVNVGSSNVSGSVKFDYSFMPLEAGSYRIPDVKLVYFNPSTGKYETSVARGYDINVKEGKGSAKSQTRNLYKFDSELMGVNQASLKKEHRLLVDLWYYWLWYIIPLFAFVIFILTYRHYLSTHADMVAFNSRRADKLARRRLRKAGVCMKKGEREAFYDEMLSALWGYIGFKLKMPNSELMRENIKSVLSSRNIPEENINSFVDLLNECEFAKYSSSSSGLSMQEIYSKGISVINSMEQSFKNSHNNED